MLFSVKTKKSIYICLNLHSNPHYTYASLDEILHTVDELNALEGVSIEMCVYHPEHSYMSGDFIKVYNYGGGSNDDDWNLVGNLYKELEMNKLLISLLKQDLECGEWGNHQCCFGYAAYAYARDSVMSVWKPDMRKGTTKNDIKCLAIMKNVVIAVYGVSTFFCDRE